jgi:hypothetical protein
MFEKEIEKIENLLSSQRNLFYEIEETNNSVVVSFLMEDPKTISEISELMDIINKINLQVFITGFRNQINVFKNQFYEWELEVEFIKYTQKTYTPAVTSTYTPPKVSKEEIFTDTTGLEVTEDRKRDFILKSISQEISSTELLFIEDALKEKNDDFDGPIYGGSTNYYYWKLNSNILNVMKYRNNIFVITYFNSFSGKFRYFICYGINDIKRLPIR